MCDSSNTTCDTSYKCHKDCDARPISKPGIIKKPGCYCLTNNVTGNGCDPVFRIESDNVVLDLNCHEIDACDFKYAIVVCKQYSVTIKNGTIKNANIHIKIIGSKVVTLTDLNFKGSQNKCDNRNNTALQVLDSSKLCFKNLNISGFENQKIPIVDFDSCNDACLKKVSICNNLKLLNCNSDYYGSFFNIKSSSNFNLNKVYITDNLVNALEPVQPNFCPPNFLFVTGFRLEDCSDMVHENCKFNNNTINCYNLFRGTFAKNSNNLQYNNHQTSNNKLIFLSAKARMYELDNCQSVGLNNSQANTNYLNELHTVDNDQPFAQGEFSGIKIFNSEDVTIRSCQVNKNTVENGGSLRTNFNAKGVLGGIVVERTDGNHTGTVIENTQTNNNQMLNTPMNTIVTGIRVNGNSNIIIRRSNMDNNVGGYYASGFQVSNTSTGKNRNALIEGCSANSNGDFGIHIGDPVLVETGSDNYVIKDSVTSFNGSVNSKLYGAGIAVTRSSNTLLIKNCKADQNSVNGCNSYGIYLKDQVNAQIEDCTTNQNTSEGGFGHGIQLDNCLNCQVLKTTTANNTSNGIEITNNGTGHIISEILATNNQKGIHFSVDAIGQGAIIQDCRANNNTLKGFHHETALLRSSYIGNHTINNGQVPEDHFDITGGIISLHEVFLATSIMCHVHGGASLGVRFTNIRTIY